MATFRSQGDFFQAVADLVTRLEATGFSSAATRLKNGLGCVNGLTDGWALFLESIVAVEIDDAARLDPADRESLEAIRKAVDDTVRRR